jgi:predicted TIM-barrel fold metal-dependent hydrolase
MKRDLHHHFIPKALNKYIPDLPDWTVQKSLDYMKEQRIDKVFLSLSDYNVPVKSKKDFIQFCRDANRELFDIVKKHLNEFEGFGILPFPFIDESIEELKVCLENYRFSGMTLYSNYHGVYPSFLVHKELFDEFNKRGVKLFLHPATTPLINGKKYDGINSFIEYPQEITRLFCRFLVEEGFETHKNISYVLSHGGGDLFFLFDRISKLIYAKVVNGSIKPRLGRIIGDLIKKRNRLLEYMSLVEIETSGFTGPEQLAVLKTYISDSKICFGSNYPYLNE